MIEAIAPSPDDRFLEIGPGLGALTLRLAPRVRHLTAVEVDRDLAAELAPRLPPTAELMTADILDLDLSPFLTAGPLRVAGNLPYNISSPILFKLLQIAACDRLRQGYGGPPKLHAEAERPGLQESETATAHSRRADLSGPPLLIDATLMLQLEVAERLTARPGTKDYGVLTIFTAVQADVERLLTLPPGAFRPAPRVHSALVRLRFTAPIVPAESRDVFDRMVRTMFMQRRKTVLNALRPFAESLQESSASALSAAGIDPVRRPETLAIPELVRLASSMSHRP